MGSVARRYDKFEGYLIEVLNSKRYNTTVRPDSLYGAIKSFGENLGRYYIENQEFLKRFYALRICPVNMFEYDHLSGDAYEHWVIQIKVT